jgi:hypothetical protein
MRKLAGLAAILGGLGLWIELCRFPADALGGAYNAAMLRCAAWLPIVWGAGAIARARHKERQARLLDTRPRSRGVRDLSLDTRLEGS